MGALKCTRFNGIWSTASLLYLPSFCLTARSISLSIGPNDANLSPVSMTEQLIPSTFTAETTKLTSHRENPFHYDPKKQPQNKTTTNQHVIYLNWCITWCWKVVRSQTTRPREDYRKTHQMSSNQMVTGNTLHVNWIKSHNHVAACGWVELGQVGWVQKSQAD